MNFFWAAAVVLQTIPNAPFTAPVSLVDGGFCAWPLWVALGEGETASRTEGIDTARYDITLRDGRTVSLISSGNGVGVASFRNNDFSDVRADGRDRWQVRRRSDQVVFRYVFQRRDARVARFSEPIISILSVSGEGLDDAWLARFSSRTEAERRCGTV